ncbi:HNH endonuclease [Labrenzia sp. PO1]|uniref:HNH endonuclease n=1 Tax=Labrenzia sp. PO1 TaxID=2720390 RepID=UPI001447524C|nr:HNH endonuclease signature motif containing protein [Labrenzia sp. PO1]NKI61757.1 HNH endonuclease [Labrenzia sp. PO1]
MKYNDLNSRDAVLDAIEECDALGRDAFLEKYGYKRARTYTLHHGGKTYDTKAMYGVAYGKQHGKALRSRDFTGGVATVVPVFEKLGFVVSKVTHPAEVLEVGKTYFRKGLRDLFGGQLQAGIWTPKEFPVVFIFSGESGAKYGYKDGWTAEGVFKYTGEGQSGDMTFTNGNAAIRNHRQNNEDILLFEDLGKGKGVRYVGLFDFVDWNEVDGFDEKKNRRKLIVFDLVRVDTPTLRSDETFDVEVPGASRKTLVELRQAAYTAADPAGSKPKVGKALTVWRERSKAVRDYVLARARGLCEACEQPAPFSKKDGSAYLEAHHIERLADDGPDRPDSVTAICPNCHRRIHNGADGAEWNDRVRHKVSKLEKKADQA